jgi:transposase
VKSITEFQNLYLHRAPVDLRKNINGLAAIVEAEMKLDLRGPSLFIFCNQRRTHMKMIYFDRSGFALWLKRLEDSKFPWPLKLEAETIQATVEDLKLVLEGVNVWTRFEEVCFDRVV